MLSLCGVPNFEWEEAEVQEGAESPAVAGLKPMLVTGWPAVPRLPGSKTWPQMRSYRSQGIADCLMSARKNQREHDIVLCDQ